MNLAESMRPISLSEVIGNEHIVNSLKKQFVDNSLSQTIMFTGEAGTGKTTFAKIIARHLDAEVIEIDCGSQGNVENMREVVESVSLTSLFSKSKVFILDEVHALSKPGQSALLKTLEDPVDGVHFILLTTDPQKVLNTIRTRCVVYETRQADTNDIGKAVKRVEEQYKISFENRKDLWSLVEQSQGSLRQVYSNLEKLIAISDDNGFITSDNFYSILGKPMDKVDENLPKAIMDKDLQKAFSIITGLKKEGGNPTGTLLGIYNYLKAVYLKPTETPGQDTKKLMAKISYYLIDKEVNWVTVEHIIWDNL